MRLCPTLQLSSAAAAAESESRSSSVRNLVGPQEREPPRAAAARRGRPVLRACRGGASGRASPPGGMQGEPPLCLPPVGVAPSTPLDVQIRGRAASSRDEDCFWGGQRERDRKPNSTPGMRAGGRNGVSGVSSAAALKVRRPAWPMTAPPRVASTLPLQRPPHAPRPTPHTPRHAARASESGTRPCCTHLRAGSTPLA